MSSNPSRTLDVTANTGAFNSEDPSLTSDPSKGQQDGQSKDIDPADSHSGEGLASVRPRLARTLADAAQRNQDKELETIPSSIPSGTPSEPEPEIPVP